MLTPGDVVDLDLGMPTSHEAGLCRSAVVVTAARVLSGGPNVVQVVPFTRTIRHSSVEVLIDPDEVNGLDARSATQCQHVRSVSISRIQRHRGNIGPALLAEVRETLSLLMDL